MRAPAIGVSSVSAPGRWLDLFGGALVHDVPVVDDVDALRQRQRGREILLDQHDGQARRGQVAADLHQLAHDQRRKPFERLVEQDDLRIADEGAGDRQHLLLAARQVGAAAGAPLLQAREHLVDAIERPSVARRQAGEDQVLLDVQAAEHAPLLVHQLHARARDRRGSSCRPAPRRRASPSRCAASPRPSGSSASCSCRRRCARAAPPPRSSRPAGRRRTGCANRRSSCSAP